MEIINSQNPRGALPGGILFGESGGSLSQDTKLYWDDTSNNLSIGNRLSLSPLSLYDNTYPGPLVMRVTQDDNNVTGLTIANNTSHSGVNSGLRLYISDTGIGYIDTIQNISAKQTSLNPLGGAVIINGTTTTMSRGLDIWGNELLIGGNGLGLRDDATQKSSRLFCPHYANATPTGFFSSSNNLITNSLNLGGGTSAFYANTKINFCLSDVPNSNNSNLCMSIDNLGNVTLPLSKMIFDYTYSSTVGSQTIDKPTGSLIIGLGQSSVTLTNSHVTSSCLPWVFPMTDDSTARIKNVLRGTGILTINMVGPVTLDTRLGFMIINFVDNF